MDEALPAILSAFGIAAFSLFMPLLLLVSLARGA